MAINNCSDIDRTREDLSRRSGLRACTGPGDPSPGFAARGSLRRSLRRTRLDPTVATPKGVMMRRLIAVAGLVGCFVVVGYTGWGDASTGGAHAASTVPLVILKAKDGERLALARVIIHGRAFPFLIDTGSSKTLVDD